MASSLITPERIVAAQASSDHQRLYSPMLGYYYPKCKSWRRKNWSAPWRRATRMRSGIVSIATHTIWRGCPETEGCRSEWCGTISQPGAYIPHLPLCLADHPSQFSHDIEHPAPDDFVFMKAVAEWKGYPTFSTSPIYMRRLELGPSAEDHHCQNIVTIKSGEAEERTNP